jgi:hypothetical protein
VVCLSRSFAVSPVPAPTGLSRLFLDGLVSKSVSIRPEEDCTAGAGDWTTHRRPAAVEEWGDSTSSKLPVAHSAR